MPASLPSLRSFSSAIFCLFTVAVLAIILSACSASEEAMKGALGEFCAADSHCRSGLVCQNNSCSCVNPLACSSCETICNRLNSCAVSVANCTGVCQNTVEQWSEESITTFEQCFTTGLSCEQLQVDDEPAQTCYDFLPPIADDRRTRCNQFREAARSCGASGNAFDRFSRECPIFARTRSDEVWSATDACTARVAEGFCPDILDCLDQVFEVRPPMGGGDSLQEDEFNDDAPVMNFENGAEMNSIFPD